MAWHPLHANLPTRGQRHTFTQVLQTEVNQPMTLRFSAAGTRETGWFSRLSLGLGCFVALWILVVLFSFSTKRKQPDNSLV
ncbi:MAG: hypothetical protein WCO56_01570 [Verrucomicrobiota bacterium]